MGSARRGLVVDLFCGGGGASLGLEAALGRPVDVANNHNEVALAVHAANHPHALHLHKDVWEVSPRLVTRGRKVDVLWASPDCTHHSNAKGGKPVEQGIRSLAWVVRDWARDVRPAVVFLENVREFQDWGPLYPDDYPDVKLRGRPVPERKGETFRQFIGCLELLGYRVEWRVLDASHFGAPTKRRRLFLVARCDGQPIRWPEATHGPGLLPVHTAAECIDWSLPCPSIFERKRPLAPKTLWRIAEGVRKYVLESPQPFVVGVGGRAGQSPATPADAPVGTITAKADRALVVPNIIKVNHGGMTARSEPLDEPLSTVTAQRRGHALVAPFVVQARYGSEHFRGQPLEQPLSTITGFHGHALVAPTLIQTGYGEREGQAARTLDLHEPLGTVMATGQKHALVQALLLNKHYGGVVGQEVERPLGTVTATDHHSLAAVSLVKMRGDCNGAPVDEPMPTLTAMGNHVAEVRAFLTAYYGGGSQGQSLHHPMRTITALHRLGLVTVHGVQHQIVDIGMRMLEPHELLRAQFGRFAASYDLSAATTKARQVRLIGNSVCPEMAEALVRANLGEGATRRRAA